MKTPVMRAQAKQSGPRGTLDCFVACAPRNDGEEHYRVAGNRMALAAAQRARRQAPGAGVAARDHPIDEAPTMPAPGHDLE